MIIMDKNINNYFNKHIKVNYPEIVSFELITPEIGKVKLIASNGKYWCGRIFVFTDKNYKELVGKSKSMITAGIDINKIF